MSSIEIIIAAVPVAAYLGLIGIILCSQRALVVSGGLDVFFLAMGLIGLVMIGPVKLLFPIGALYTWGWRVFPMLVVLYGLVAILIAGALGLRIVLYNVTEDTFRSILTEFLRRINQSENEQNPASYDLSGNSVRIPSHGIQFCYEIQKWNRCVIIRPTTKDQRPANWLYFDHLLMEITNSITIRQNFRIGGVLLVCSLALWITSAYHGASAYREFVAMFF